MTRRRTPILLGALFGALFGLVPLAPVPRAWALPDETHAQPELPKETLTIVGADGARHEFQVEMALTDDQQRVGLMFRPSVPADGGMLFVLGTPQDLPMWMKNTVTPLDMIFIGGNGAVGHIAENTVPQSLAVIGSGGPVKAVLEVAAGTARRLNIRVGDRVEQRVLGAR